jgi:3-hydroxyisobutyrate dehydrogenase-like beta-hydroxyacid dehydrogenase
MQYLEGCQSQLGQQQPQGKGPGPQRVFIDCSTVLPSTSRRLATVAAARGVAYLTCPVFGRPLAAAAGVLVACLAGGDAGVRAQLKPLVATFAGKGIWDLGDDAGEGVCMRARGGWAMKICFSQGLSCMETMLQSCSSFLLCIIMLFLFQG